MRGGTGVLVTQGKVRVDGPERLVLAGRGNSTRANRTSPSPRASHLLDWNPGVDGRGRRRRSCPPANMRRAPLTAIDPTGQEARLSLRKYHVDVTSRDGFRADHHRPDLLQPPELAAWRGRSLPLRRTPPLSRLAIVRGRQPMEGGMRSATTPAASSRTIVNRQKDPPSWSVRQHVKMRVFPWRPARKRGSC